MFIQKDCLEKDEYVSWGAYHACKSEDPKIPNISNISSYPTPIFLKKANEPAMLAHLMLLADAMTQKLNPGQTPLYDKLKLLQQKYPDTFGENKFFLAMGALHTEKCLWGASGDFVSGSGYTSALTSSGVCTSGIAELIPSVSNIMRTRYVKQV